MSDVYGQGWPQANDLQNQAMLPQQPFGLGAPAPGQPMNIVPGAKPPMPAARPGAPGGLSPQLLQMIQQMTGGGQLQPPPGAGAAPTPGPSPMFRALMPSAYNMPGAQ